MNIYFQKFSELLFLFRYENYHFEHYTGMKRMILESYE